MVPKETWRLTCLGVVFSIDYRALWTRSLISSQTELSRPAGEGRGCEIIIFSPRIHMVLCVNTV